MNAKAFLQTALFIIGDNPPTTIPTQWASFLWKCICHILYQLGLLTLLESIGIKILPTVLCDSVNMKNQGYSANLAVKAYRKLHEVALKGK